MTAPAVLDIRVTRLHDGRYRVSMEHMGRPRDGGITCSAIDMPEQVRSMAAAVMQPRASHARTRWDAPRDSIADAVRALPVVPATCGECHGLSSIDRLYDWCRALDQGVALRLSPPADCPLRKGDA